MTRLLSLRLPRHFLALALVVASQHVPSLGQSSLATNTPTLEVLSADYNPDTDTIQFTLANRGNRAATAYDVVFGLKNDANHVQWGPGFGEDVLNLALNRQCRDVGQNAAQNADGDKPWEGAIGPEDTYVKSVPANLDKNLLNGSATVVQAKVVGVIWSDGSVEEDPAFPWAIASIKSSREQRKKDASDSAKVVAILNAHSDDPDIQHRIGEAIQSLQAQSPDSPRVQRAPGEASHGPAPISPTVGSTLTTLKLFASSPNPAETFEAYRAFLECQNERRTALLGSAPPATPGQ